MLAECSVSANIISRGRRSLGYGFVEFASEAEAVKAVEAMNKKEISGRAINVEVARTRDPSKEAEASEKRAPKPRQPRAPKAAAPAGAAEGTAAAGTSAAPANGGNRRGPRGPRRNAAPAGTEGAASPNGAAAAPSTNGAGNGARGRGPRGPRRNPAPRRPRTEQDARPSSDTTLFVANVPFSTDDEQLKSFFAEHKPKSAHVVRMRNGRSRGYGFVEFDNAAGQQAGLAVDGKDVPLPNGQTLKLSVKVAMTPPPVVEGSEAAPTTAQ